MLDFDFESEGPLPSQQFLRLLLLCRIAPLDNLPKNNCNSEGVLIGEFAMNFGTAIVCCFLKSYRSLANRSLKFK